MHDPAIHLNSPEVAVEPRFHDAFDFVGVGCH
jgi:hypothetical protein